MHAVINYDTPFPRNSDYKESPPGKSYILSNGSYLKKYIINDAIQKIEIHSRQRALKSMAQKGFRSKFCTFHIIQVRKVKTVAANNPR